MFSLSEKNVPPKNVVKASPPPLLTKFAKDTNESVFGVQKSPHAAPQLFSIESEMLYLVILDKQRTIWWTPSPHSGLIQLSETIKSDILSSVSKNEYAFPPMLFVLVLVWERKITMQKREAFAPEMYRDPPSFTQEHWKNLVFVTVRLIGLSTQIAPPLFWSASMESKRQSVKIVFD